MPDTDTSTLLTDAIAEARASAHDSAEARVWLALLALVLHQDDAANE